MIIQNSRNIAPIDLKRARSLPSVIADPARPVSFDADIASQLGVATGPAVQATPHFILRGLDLGTLQPDETKALNGLIKQASGAMLRDLKAAHPMIGGALEGYELVGASIDTYEAWTDPKGPSFVKAGGTTVKAMSEAVGALKAVVPGLAQHPLVGTATLVLSVAGQAFQLCATLAPGAAAKT